MINSNNILLNICLLLILIGCSPEQTKNPKAESASPLVSNSYKAPIFVNDDRKEKIRKIGPEMQKLIMEHVKAKKIPAIAYGIVVDNELLLSSATEL